MTGIVVDFSAITTANRDELALIDTLRRVDARHWADLCSRFVMDVGAQLHAHPVLAVGIVLNLVENIQRLPGGRALSDPRDLHEAIAQRYRRWERGISSVASRATSRAGCRVTTNERGWQAFFDTLMRISRSG